MAAVMKLDTLGYAARMFSRRLLDEQFQQLLLLQDGSEENLVAKIVTLFCQEAERIIGELSMQLDRPCVNFEEVAAFADKLEGSSAW
ncbi:histidine-containing phosphotransfer protein 2-like [Lolium rigidum]|uniref:histidine-containing phosphotransfer protein 2-like n=1 Tax=Lolium rigidum TaxID=89674 RepID=UPI001F5D51C5|nr:histidine-containing phosphotransfer protein 2-like [Lolium rigidum]